MAVLIYISHSLLFIMLFIVVGKSTGSLA